MCIHRHARTHTRTPICSISYIAFINNKYDSIYTTIRVHNTKTHTHVHQCVRSHTYPIHSIYKAHTTTLYTILYAYKTRRNTHTHTHTRDVWSPSRRASSRDRRSYKHIPYKKHTLRYRIHYCTHTKHEHQDPRDVWSPSRDDDRSRRSALIDDDRRRRRPRWRCRRRR